MAGEQPLEPIDLTLTIRSEESQLRTHLHSPYGEYLSGVRELPMDDLQQPAATVLADIRSAARVGRTLFDLVRSEQLRSVYDAATRDARAGNTVVRLRLRFESTELAALPWELLYDPAVDEFLALTGSVSIARDLPGAAAGAVPPQAAPLEILAMGAAPVDLPPIDLARERRQLEALAAQHPAEIALTWIDGQQWPDLLHMVAERPAHVLHFLGHGVVDPAVGGGIFLRDGQEMSRFLTAGDLARIVADSSLRLVFLNACSGATLAEATAATIADRLVARGVPAVVAMQSEIEIETAGALTAAVYRSLAQDPLIDRALNRARRTLSVRTPESAAWAIPVLFVGPDGGYVHRAVGTAKTAAGQRTQTPGGGEREVGRPTINTSLHNSSVDQVINVNQLDGGLTINSGKRE